MKEIKYEIKIKVPNEYQERVVTKALDSVLEGVKTFFSGDLRNKFANKDNEILIEKR